MYTNTSRVKIRRVRGGEFFFEFYCHLLHARIGEELFLVNKTQASESWGSVGGSDLANHSSLSLFLHKNHSWYYWKLFTELHDWRFKLKYVNNPCKIRYNEIVKVINCSEYVLMYFKNSQESQPWLPNAPVLRYIRPGDI